MELDIKGIMDRLPHRYPMLLIDRVLEMVPGKSIVAIKNVSINEPFFTGHFPHHPVMPGVLIVEAMAQASAVLVHRRERRAEVRRRQDRLLPGGHRRRAVP